MGDLVGQLVKCTTETSQLLPEFIISLENSTLKFPSHWKIKKGKHLYKADTGCMAVTYPIYLEGVTNTIRK